MVQVWETNLICHLQLKITKRVKWFEKTTIEIGEGRKAFGKQVEEKICLLQSRWESQSLEWQPIVRQTITSEGQDSRTRR